MDTLPNYQILEVGRVIYSTWLKVNAMHWSHDNMNEHVLTYVIVALDII